MVKRTTALRRSRGLLLCELCNGGRYLRTFQWEISSPRTQVSFQFFAICIILNIYKRFMLKKLGNKNKNFRRSSTLIKNISTINVAEVARVDISSVSHLTVLRLFKLLDFNCIATMECGGCLHGHQGDIRASASPLWFPFMALYFVFMIPPQSVMPAQVTPA